MFTPPYILAEYTEVTKLDINGDPYQGIAWVDKNRNYAELWKSFRESFNEGVQYANSIGGNGLHINARAVEAHFEQDILNPKTRL